MTAGEWMMVGGFCLAIGMKMWVGVKGWKQAKWVWALIVILWPVILAAAYLDDPGPEEP